MQLANEDAAIIRKLRCTMNRHLFAREGVIRRQSILHYRILQKHLFWQPGKDQFAIHHSRNKPVHRTVHPVSVLEQ